MDSVVQKYCSLGIAQSTHKVYTSAFRRFQSFCAEFKVCLPIPVTESLLCYFAAFLAQSGLAPSSIKVYLSAVRHTQVLMGYPEPRSTSTLPRLRLVLNGIAKSRARNGPAGKPRLPITIEILRRLFSSLRSQPPSFETVMLWAACSLCYFGFFREGEITVTSKASFDPRCHLAWGDISTDSVKQPTCIKVLLKVSKCDQLGKGVEVFVGRVERDEVCPVVACCAYMALRGDRPGPFFCYKDGSPFTKASFVTQVREALTNAGLDASLYSGHSFRIGAATSAAHAGMQDTTIKSLGRWSSGAFMTYIRTPRQQLAKFSVTLARL